MKRIPIKLMLASMLLAGACLNASADIEVEYHASVTAQTSTKSLSPYMLGSWNQGRYMEGNGIWQEAGILKPIDLSRRFDWSVGVDYLAGVGEKTDYARWDEESKAWTTSPDRRNAFRLTQLFGQLKYRAVYLTIGMKNSKSRIVDDRLSSGDLTRSNNAAPIPGVAAGFLDFVDIPFTKGWVQIDGEIMYGRMTDSHFKEREFNYNYGVLSTNLYYNYKRCYFRTNPDKNFHITVGMQAAAMFGGTSVHYYRGEISGIEDRGFRFKDLFQAFFPQEGGETFYDGSHLGSWDFKASYRLRNGSLINAYFEWPWEDGSGIGRMNGWDGLWGVQYDFAKSGPVTKAVVEYLDFTNQSGPILYSPADHPESSITDHVSGGDDYYNNYFYGGYTNYGMGIGTPFLVAPIYNRDGMLSYLHSRARGFHAAIEGEPTEQIGYRVMVGYAKAGGNGMVPAYKRTHSTSAMIEGRWKPSVNLPGLELGLRMAFDKGELRGDNFGAQIQIAYSGDFNFKKN